MSREIKFRAWSVKEKYMFYAGSLSGISDFFKARSKDYNDYEEHYNRFCDVDYKWMQYTGLKDKNDKEIYEGDIIKQSNDTGVIIYTDGRFEIKIDGDNYFMDNSLFIYKNFVEVIGNIYENSELLKEVTS